MGAALRHASGIDYHACAGMAFSDGQDEQGMVNRPLAPKSKKRRTALFFGQIAT